MNSVENTIINRLRIWHTQSRPNVFDVRGSVIVVKFLIHPLSSQRKLVLKACSMLATQMGCSIQIDPDHPRKPYLAVKFILEA